MRDGTNDMATPATPATPALAWPSQESCLRFVGLPEMPQLARINATRDTFRLAQIEARARLPRRFGWRVEGSAMTTPAQELATSWGGMVFVGESQVREVAWATLVLLAGSDRPLRLRPGSARSVDAKGGEWAVDELTAAIGSERNGSAGNGSCFPHVLGKTGWTALCPHDERVACEVAPAFTSRAHELQLISTWLRDDHPWDGRMDAVDGELACAPAVIRGEATFLSYQGSYHIGEPLDPASLPPCLRLLRGSSAGHGGGGSDGDGGHVRSHSNSSNNGGKRSARVQRLLLVANGAALHQNQACSPWRLQLPAHVFAHFHRNGSRLRLPPDWQLMWQTTSGGWLPQPQPRGCDLIEIDEIVAASRRWLLETRVALSYDYTTLAAALAPLMSDGNHFVYYHAKCSAGMPHIPHMAAQLLLRTAAGRDVRFCQ